MGGRTRDWGTYLVKLVNKPLQAAGKSADNVRGWEIVRKMNIWPRSEALRANVKFWGQSLSQGHYQPTLPTSQKGGYLFYNPPINFYIAQKPLVKKPVLICWRMHAIDVNKYIWLVYRNFIFTVIMDQNLTNWLSLRRTKSESLLVTFYTFKDVDSMFFFWHFCTFQNSICDQLFYVNMTGHRQNEFVFLPCKIIKMIRWNSWAGFFSAGFVSFQWK